MDSRKRKISIFITAVIFAAAFVLINLISVGLSGKIRMKFDLTENRIFRLSDTTLEYLKTIPEDVKLYYMTEAGNESPYVQEVIERYSMASGKISSERIDMISNPLAAKAYSVDGEAVAKGSIVVESSRRFMVVDPGTAITIQRDANRNVTRDLGFTLEQKLTNAIDYVLKEKNITVRYVSNHGGADFKLPAGVLRNENMTVEPDALDGDTDADLLVLFGLREDLSDSEYKKVTDYIKSGGKLFIATNPSVDLNALTNINSIMTQYGFFVGNDIIVENDAGKRAANNRLYVLADMEEHKITENLAGKGKILFPAASSLTIEPADNFKAEYLVSTSETASANVMQKSSIGEPISEGKTGLAGLSENMLNGSMVFASTTTQFLKTEDSKLGNVLSSSNYMNSEFFIQTVKYMTDSEGTLIPVSPKSIASRSITLTAVQKTVLSVIFGIIIPVIVLAAGIVIWIKRKNL